MSYKRTYWHDLKNLTVTGESTRCTFDSSTRISRAFEHNAFTSDSFMISQRLSCSIWRSKSLISVRNCLNLVADTDFLNASFDFFFCEWITTDQSFRHQKLVNTFQKTPIVEMALTMFKKLDLCVYLQLYLFSIVLMSYKIKEIVNGKFYNFGTEVIVLFSIFQSQLFSSNVAKDVKSETMFKASRRNHSSFRNKFITTTLNLQGS